MTQVLLIRHGESQANVERFFAGHLDSPLTGLGMAQAKCTAEFISREYTVDAVYSSDLARAWETGCQVARPFGLEVRKEPQFREIFGGQWEGKTFDQLQVTFPEDYGLWQRNIGAARCTGGEAAEELAARIFAAVETLCRKNPDSCLAVATHAMAIRALLWRLSGRPLSYMQELSWVSNASVTEVFYEDGVFRLGKVSRDAHLATMKTKLPANV